MSIIQKDHNKRMVSHIMITMSAKQFNKSNKSMSTLHKPCRFKKKRYVNKDDATNNRI